MDVINIIINVFFYFAGFMIAQHYTKKRDASKKREASTKELISWQHGYNEGYEVAYKKGFSDAKSIYKMISTLTEDQPKQITEAFSSSKWKHKFVRKKTHAGKWGV